MASLLADIPPPPAPLPAYALTYWDAFNALRHDREHVVVPEMVTANGVPVVSGRIVEQPITFAAIDRYAARHGLAGKWFARLFRLVTALDDEYRTVLAEQRAGHTQTDEASDG